MLSKRQLAYLLAAYEEDHTREAMYRGPSNPPKTVWRWIEYGHVTAPWLDSGDSRLLSSKLLAAGVIHQRPEATWRALANRGLLRISYADTGHIETCSGRPVMSLMIRLTKKGREYARTARNKPPVKRTAQKPSLSLLDLQLVRYGQEHPDMVFDYHAPWGGCSLPYPMMLGVCRRLVMRGLLTGDPPSRLRISESGIMLDLSRQPNWKAVTPLQANPNGL